MVNPRLGKAIVTALIDSFQSAQRSEIQSHVLIGTSGNAALVMFALFPHQ